MFTLDPRLEADGLALGELPLCLVRLARDARYPWLVLVPRRADVREIHELDASDRQQLIEEIALAARALEATFQPTKVNVAALGNVVPQLHLHVVARFEVDDAWPGPIWGKHSAKPYEPDALEARARTLRAALGL